MTARLGERLERAAARRAAIEEVADAYRLVHGAGDGLPGLVVERLVDTALIRYRDPTYVDAGSVDRLLGALRAVGLPKAWFLFDAPAKDRTPATTARDAALNARQESAGAGPDASIVAHEYGTRFRLDARAGFSCGLFFDMREPRHDLAQRWRDRRVLNLFSYTCGFGAVLAPHNDVVNVDTSAPALSWGKENYALNGIDSCGSSFVRRDAFGYLEVAAKVGNRFDAIVLDPPSYSAGKKGKARRFSIVKDLASLVQLAASVLTPGGELFVSTNAESFDPTRFRSIIGSATRGTGLVESRRWLPAADFPVSPVDYHLKTTLLSRGR